MSDASEKPVLVERQGAVGIVRLNRPSALNALNAALITELGKAFDDLEFDPAIGAIIVQGTFAVADSILTLSVLGYLTLGVAPPSTDWGSMLSVGLTYIQGGNYWWLIYPPGVLIILTCISFNFIGDALRDALETRLQRR